MGLFGGAKQKTPQHDMLLPQAVDTKKISAEKMKRDLEKLGEFESKLKAKKQVLDVSLDALKPEDAALRLKNPFRGK